MAKVFLDAQWIWPPTKNQVNEYADFIGHFKTQDNAVLRISAISDYVVFVNGKLVGHNQYRDFPDEKVYDSYTLTGNILNNGINYIAIRALSMNYETSSRITDGKGIIFEVESGGEIVLASGADVLSRVSRDYVSGPVNKISGQLGYSFSYDFTHADNWIAGSAAEYESWSKPEKGFDISQIVEKHTHFYQRPVERMLYDYIEAKQVKKYIYDLGYECCGYLSFDITAPEDCTITVSFGEHLADKRVRKLIGDRCFWAVIKLKKGQNIFDEYFLRLGLRYLQIESDVPLLVARIGVRKSLYPLTIMETHFKDTRHHKIYDTAVKTLINCMHEHYEDCPWREQAQYTMDARTQMLCGYYAFGEYRFPRTALKQMIHSLTEDNLVRITSPSHSPIAIPNYSLVYFQMINEYIEHSGDTAIAAEVYDKCKMIIDGFISRMRGGLIPFLKSWNFQEWSQGMDFQEQIHLPKEDLNMFSLPTNAFFVIALRNFDKISRVCKKPVYNYLEIADTVLKQINDNFYDKKKQVFHTFTDLHSSWHVSEFANVMALYASAIDGKGRDVLIKKLIRQNFKVPISLNNCIFKYEVLLNDAANHKHILKDIQKKWGYMLKKGATSFWETMLGEKDFFGAGSLCHGWSATPVYIFHKLQGYIGLTNKP